jgi:uncharacterized membrane protein
MLAWGVGLALLEVLFLAVVLAADTAAGLRLLSMIGACHLGGRLAFIGAGFEGGLSALAIVGIVTFHNGAVVLLIYPLCLLLSQNLERVPFLASLRENVQLSRNLRSRWNLLGIALFIWVPLPMTGAVVGTLLAHFEGYKPRQVLPVALGSMAAGVVSWTLAFEQLYAWMRGIGPHVTTAVTFFLVVLPLVLNALRRKESARTVSYRIWPFPRP